MKNHEVRASLSRLSRRHFLTLTGACCGAITFGNRSTVASAETRPPWPNRARVEKLNGRPVLFINDEPVPPIAYMSYLGETPYYREVAQLGIHLYCFPAYLGDRGINTNSGIGPFRDGIWKGEDIYDFSSIETDFEKILEADPEARVIIRLHMDPPAWWEVAHPEGCCQLPDGSTFRQCFSSSVWRDATSKVFLDCLDWLQASPYARYLVGIHVAAGFTEEWFYHFRSAFHDENPARLHAFRDWLRHQYDGKLSALQSAWNDDNITFEEAYPADISGEIREETWLPKNEHRARFDTMAFHTETMVENIAWFCQLVKQQSNGRLLTGAFYGYHYFVTDNRRGHGALGQLLDCPDLDYLSSPNVYNRVMGEDWPPMVAVSSVQHHGKLWLAENDTRTFKTTPLKDRAPGIAPPGQYEDGVWIGPDNVEDSVTLLRKNTARMLAYGYGGWWFDMWGGWFSDPQMLSVLGSSLEFGRENLTRHISDMNKQIAVIVDETLSFQDGSFGSLAEGILSNRYMLGKIGTSYDLLLRGDMSLLERTPYRFVWLLGITDVLESEQFLLQQCIKQGTHVLHTGFKDSVLLKPNQEIILMETTVRFTPSQLRNMCREAGVHQYLDSDDVVYAGYGWLGIHSIEGGERVVRFPFEADVRNAFSGRILGTKVWSLPLRIEPRSTLLLQIEPA